MKTQTDHRKYVEARNRVNRQIREIKYGTQRRIRNMLRARKRPVNEYAQLNQVNAKQWEQYLTELYNNEASENDSGNKQISLRRKKLSLL
ncbi:hypothetical protein HHI36_009159 [Cryptolaemus montrouzieri]|uniref:Uncharacterized protein n=1 Tax=Cryptolaemus montrouzieri TaxID=559131 RepID=A0ABD2MVF3_9CUCU